MNIKYLYETKAGAFTYAAIVAPTMSDVALSIMQYFAQYDLRGYATKVIQEPMINFDGTWSARIQRYSSCD